MDVLNKLLYISLILFIFTSCKKEEFDIQNINGNRIDVLGHAGMGSSNLYPINSLESIANCIAIGADGTEIDVQLTSDSVLIAFHDQDLATSTTGSGAIHDLTWIEISEERYVNAPYSDYNIVKLTDIFSAIDNHSELIFTFDVQLNPGSSDPSAYKSLVTDRLFAFFNTYDLWNHVYIESQDLDFLGQAKSMSDNWRLYYSPQNFDQALIDVINRGLHGISISTDNVTEEQVANAHAQGVYVTIWDVKSKNENVEAVRKNPDMIQSDNLDYLIDLLK